MKGFTKILVGLGFAGAAALLSGCVVAPGRAYVRVAPPAVVVHPYYGGYYYGRRW
jgi:hypothetical protein